MAMIAIYTSIGANTTVLTRICTAFHRIYIIRQKLISVMILDIKFISQTINKKNRKSLPSLQNSPV